MAQKQKLPAREHRQLQKHFPGGNVLEAKPAASSAQDPHAFQVQRLSRLYALSVAAASTLARLVYDAGAPR